MAQNPQFRSHPDAPLLLLHPKEPHQRGLPTCVIELALGPLLNIPIQVLAVGRIAAPQILFHRNHYRTRRHTRLLSLNLTSASAMPLILSRNP